MILHDTMCNVIMWSWSSKSMNIYISWACVSALSRWRSWGNTLQVKKALTRKAISHLGGFVGRMSLTPTLFFTVTIKIQKERFRFSLNTGIMFPVHFPHSFCYFCNLNRITASCWSYQWYTNDYQERFYTEWLRPVHMFPKNCHFLLYSVCRHLTVVVMWNFS